MTPEEASASIRALTDKINHYNHQYYVESVSGISDFEFDQLLNELAALEKKFPEFAFEDSPTKRVGGDITKKFNTVKHRVRMMSLDNTYTFEELEEFDARVRKAIGDAFEYVCELKIDGVAISITYENGIMKQAVTRGDGVQGDDVTANVKTIRSVPLRLQGDDFPEMLEVRGEIYMPVPVFEKLNASLRAELEEKGLEEEEVLGLLLKNPRNTASGTLKMQDSKIVASRKLNSFLYFVLAQDLSADNHYDAVMKAKAWGFRISEHIRKYSNLAEVKGFIDYWENERHRLDFDIDGIVLKVNNYRQQNVLGNTAKSPRWAISYKYKPDRVSTVLQQVSYQVGRTGAVTPVANLRPVQLAGTTVKRASLHNADIMEELDLHIGDTVFVEKGGEIIPKIMGVDFTKRLPEMLKVTFIHNCPECGTALVRKEGEASHYCPNETGCRPQIIGKMQHFIGRKAMNIDSIGEKTIEQFYDAGYLHSIADFYTLTYDQIMACEGFQDRSTMNILDGIEKSKTVPFPRVLFGLGIRYVGETVAKKLAYHFKSIGKIMEASYEALCNVEEIGGKIAESVVAHFMNPEHVAIVEKLREQGVQMSIAEEELAGHTELLKGKTFVISGVFAKISRDDLKEMITKNGGKNTGSISKSTSYLVAGENMGPEKLKKATQLGVQIISEDEFLQLVGA